MAYFCSVQSLRRLLTIVVQLVDGQLMLVILALALAPALSELAAAAT